MTIAQREAISGFDADIDNDATDDLTYQWDALLRRVRRDDGTTASSYVQTRVAEPWTLAGIYAHRVELTTEEAMKLCDDAPQDREGRKAFDRHLDDRCQCFRSAYHLLGPDADGETLITLKMTRAIKVAGQVQVNGTPLANAFIMIHSKKTAIDQLFPRSAPELTDHEGKFSCYCFPGDLDQARIVAERPSGNRVLTLSDIQPTSTATGMMFEFDTDAKDYEVVGKPKR
ncbi:hypothetical protein [Rubripirellula reticaptiva]|uniref:Uncharacterized protein n=1 Tax=Rubripirellula reticaptiva TaxID=2528013 RepID=A0A5C6ELP8_9BACT|nr:hypothetical protein [Rubripirellula reticaptiva]TWU48209.1 hypothetical protein Poly59_50550 [Rubripirellula reticaptiva]